MRRMKRTVEECEALALADYEQVAGKVILINEITGYVGDTDDQVDLRFPADRPLAVRVMGRDDTWHDEWLDPIWDLRIADPGHPKLPPEGLRSCFIYATAYSLAGESQPTRYRLTDQQQPSPAEVEALKANWYADPCWHLEETEGFQSVRDELLAFRQETEAKWATEADANLKEYAARLGTDNLTLAAYVRRLEERVAKIENRLDAN